MLRGTITYLRSPELTLKELRKGVKEDLPKVIELWHQDDLGDHFTKGAAKKYKYRKRNSKYLKRHSPGKIDLILSGDMEEQLRRSIKISSTSKGATGRMRGPAYSKFHNKPREITAVTPKQTKDLAIFFDGIMQKRFNKVKENRKETV